MPSTVPDGLPYETLDGPDEPTSTLNGGSSGADILAVKTQAALTDIRGDVTDIDGRLTTVEGFGTPSWVKIASGSESDVASFVISGIPTETYSRVRLTLEGDASTASDPIRVRFNGDNTAAMHRSGLVVWDAEGTMLSPFTSFEDGTFWNIAQWGTGNGCTAVVEIFRTDVSTPVSFMAHGMRIGGSATSHTTSRSWGRLNESRLLDSLRVSGPSGGTMSAVWWLEGAPA